MAKLYFKYGTMGSSKTAQALITKYNYEEKGMSVWLVKPSADTRDGVSILRSRVGLESPAEIVAPDTDVLERYKCQSKRLEQSGSAIDVVIVDECQFMTASQIDQLRYIVDIYNIPVLCFGLRTDFLSTLFEGSRRLFEIADTISEIRAICDCGAKATTNARIDTEGYVVTEGDQLLLGGNDRYLAMCHRCWIRNIQEHRKVK
jgi:thymidine kinase